MKKKLLWVGDTPTVPSGFAVASRGILDTLKDHYDVTVLGINHNGDPDLERAYPYDIFMAGIGSDWSGAARVPHIANKIQADVIVVQQDGWNIPAYVHHLRRVKETKDIPLVAVVAVDGKNFNGQWLVGVSLAVFWTEFALKEARDGGYHGPAVVIPLGVDLDVYRPLDRATVRKTFTDEALAAHNLTAKAQNGFQSVLENLDNFVVGNVNRNQPRKRWDLSIRYFAKWIEDRNVNDAWLYMHAAPTGDEGVNVTDLARYYNCVDRVLYVEPPVAVGLSVEQMCKTYNCFDLLISTTQGEGWGLPAIEAMACGVPCLAPDWSGLGDWASGAAALVPCTSTRVDFPYVNVIGGVADEKLFIEALDQLYNDRALLKRYAGLGLARAGEGRFRWPSIGSAYVTAIDAILEERRLEAETAAAREARKSDDVLAFERTVERRHKILSGEVQA